MQGWDWNGKSFKLSKTSCWSQGNKLINKVHLTHQRLELRGPGGHIMKLTNLRDKMSLTW